ncbi:MAG: Sua5/YciO/YrdC/YwlC family protein [Burkholderiales bacterium]|nr:Sua5/YciO/YrdC/YwlC family protein [Burkholderiales bacterium]
MRLFDVEADAARVFDVVANGGVAIIPTHVGYAIVGATAAAIRRVFAAKRRRPSKLNAITGCRELHDELHDIDEHARAVVAAITEAYDLPLGTVAPFRTDHPMIARLDPDILAQTTHEGTVAMLLGGGPFLETLGRLSRRHQLAVIGSSANLSLHGTKFRVQDIEPEIVAAADEILDYGLMRWVCYGKSSTMLDLRDYRVVRYGVCFELIDDLLQRHFGIRLAPPGGGQG